MSLYYVQKFLYELNRSETLQEQYRADRRGAITSFELTEEEQAALIEPDIGLLFHLGVNGQILMHFAALHQIPWADYLQLMRDGIEIHGPVREGVYAITGYDGVEAHASELGQQHRAAGAPSSGESNAAANPESGAGSNAGPQSEQAETQPQPQPPSL